MTDEKTKQAYQSAAQAIIILMGNVSVLVNEVVPANFLKFWQTFLVIATTRLLLFPPQQE